MDFPQDFELKDLTIISATGEEKNVRWKMAELSVFQDIWANSITATLVLTDAENMLTNLPIYGFERCNIVFATPDKEDFSLKFRIYKVSDRQLTNERQMAYMLHLVSEEQVNNLKVRVSKSYNGKLVSDIVDDLHNNWLGGSAINIEATKFQHHIIIPNLQPIHAINWLTNRANSAGYEGALYLYYQDSTQFNFVSLESKLAEDSKQEYIFQPANIRQDTADGYKPRDLATDTIAVQSYTFRDHSDILANMAAGMYGGELITHSQVRKLWERDTFDYPTEFGDFEHLYENQLYSEASGDLASQNSKLRLFPMGHDPYPFKANEWMLKRISQLQQIHNTRLTITVPGDSERTVGDVVEFALPSPEPPIKNVQVDDKYYKGRYLVVALRHIITTKAFTTQLDLIKDSVFEAYP